MYVMSGMSTLLVGGDRTTRLCSAYQECMANLGK